MNYAGENDGKGMVAEAFSPPRMAVAAGKQGFKVGWSLDKETKDTISRRSWELTNQKDQQETIKRLKRDKPILLSISPPCTLYSPLQNLNPRKGSREWQQRFREAQEMLRFAMVLAKIQVDEGRYFVFEHPAGATSWQQAAVMEVAMMKGVGMTMVDMCAYGLKTRSDD